jgi:sRNA-binding protein
MSASYCRAVLSCDNRITLDGTPAEPVDAEAKNSATEQLAKLAARNARKAAPAAAEPKPATSTETPTALRDRVRAGLLRRRV